MGFQKGHKLSGSRKGVPNKRTQEAQEIAERLGIDPFQILLNFAVGDWKALGYKSPTSTRFVGETMIEEDVISPDLRASSAKAACEYLYPKRKAIEHQIEQGQFTSITRTVLTKAVERKPPVS